MWPSWRKNRFFQVASKACSCPLLLSTIHGEGASRLASGCLDITVMGDFLSIPCYFYPIHKQILYVKGTLGGFFFLANLSCFRGKIMVFILGLTLHLLCWTVLFISYLIEISLPLGAVVTNTVPGDLHPWKFYLQPKLWPPTNIKVMLYVPYNIKAIIHTIPNYIPTGCTYP